MKREVLHKLVPFYELLACRGAPSRLLESLFVSSDIDGKEVIAEALVGSLRKLQVCPCHHVLVQKWLRSWDCSL
jgi:hypothetical protein